MTYLEAAERVLGDAAQPLHYREITKRALQLGLIETKGKTPEATMGAQLYMAVKQQPTECRPDSAPPGAGSSGSSRVPPRVGWMPTSSHTTARPNESCWSSCTRCTRASWNCWSGSSSRPSASRT